MQKPMSYQEFSQKNDRIAELFEQRQQYARIEKSRSLTAEELSVSNSITNEYYDLCGELENEVNK